MLGLVTDLRFAWRLLRRNFEITVVAMLAMAVAIGVAATMFSVVNAVLIQPLGFHRPDRLVAIWQVDPATPATWRPSAPGNFADWRRISQSFSQIGAAVNASKTLTSFEEPETPLVQQVSYGYFDALEVHPLIGRTITPDEDRPSARAVVVLSYDLWQRGFGGDRSIIGKTTELDGVPHEVIGVMPAEFDNPIFGLTERPQLWVPLALPENGLDRTRNDIYVVARLRDGVSVIQARDELTRISAEIREQYPDTNANINALVTPLKEIIVRGIRPAVLLLLGAVLILLLIASSNVAHLLLTRSVVREREFALRQSLGASSVRLIRQLVIESLVLMTVCVVPGYFLTVWGTKSVGLLIPPGLNIPQFEFAIDRNVILFALAIAALPGLVLGLVPALYARRINLVSGLNASSRASGSRGNRRLQKALVVGEVALSMALLICAGLMVKSFRHLQSLDQGFDPKNVLTFRVSTRGAAYKENEQRQRFYKQVHDRLSNLPGVLAVGAVQHHPVYPQFGLTTAIVEGQPLPESGREPIVSALRCTPDYFGAMKIDLVDGRLFTELDTAGTQPVALVSAKAATLLWGGESPLGKRIAVAASRNVMRQVVGVVRDVRSDSFPPDPKPTIYMPLEQDSAPAAIAFVLKTESSPRTLVEAATREAQAVDRAMPVYLVRTMDEIVSGMDWRTRFVVSLLAIFSSLSLLLALTGIYAALSYLVSQRTRDIGIRMALGARRADVLWLVVKEGLNLSLTGVAIGLVGAFAMTQWMSSLVYGVATTDLVTYALIAVSMTAVSLLACFVPARRGTRVDPVIALRSE
jgi:putative ABC transport system permease protein